nr:MAG TPA: hypothetical protein [Caudoviricetes sp.]
MAQAFRVHTLKQVIPKKQSQLCKSGVTNTHRKLI